MHFNKIITTLLLAAAMLALNACTDADSPENSMSGSLSITVSDSGFGGISRAAEESYRTGFTAGDACGLYIVRSGRIISENIRVEASVGEGDQISWTTATPIYGGYEGESYFLYYPYQEDMTGKVDVSADNATGFFAPLAASWEVKADQSDYADYTSSDLMTADGIIADISAGNISLSFSMTHRMALAVIEMSKTVYRFTNTDVTIPDYILTPSVDFADGEAQPYTLTPGTYRVIVNPANATAQSISGVFSDGSKEFALTLRGMAAGSYKTYKVDNATITEINHELQPGDYLLSDGSILGKDETLSDSQKDACVGIVFYAGHHLSDASDYSATGIGQKKCHGYAVALHHRRSGVWGPDTMLGCFPTDANGDKLDNIANPDTDWNGYAWTQKIIAAIGGADMLDQGWNGYPTAYNALYDYSKEIPAPACSSGWFLPAVGQLWNVFQNRTTLLDGKDIATVLGDMGHWTSSEYSGDPKNCAISVTEYGASEYYKTQMLYYVRPVLAF